MVMGTDSDEVRARESQALLSYGFRYFETRRVLNAREILQQNIPVWYGETDSLNLMIADPITLTIPRGAGDSLQIEVQAPTEVEAPILSGQPLGKVVVKHEGELLAERPLIADRAISRAGFFARLWHSVVRFFSSIFSG